MAIGRPEDGNFVVKVILYARDPEGRSAQRGVEVRVTGHELDLPPEYEARLRDCIREAEERDRDMFGRRNGLVPIPDTEVSKSSWVSKQMPRLLEAVSYPVRQGRSPGRCGRVTQPFAGP